MKKIVVAIDGFSSCGKSTMAKALAKYAGYTYVDTGAMYRAVALYAIDHNLIDAENIDEIDFAGAVTELCGCFAYKRSCFSFLDTNCLKCADRSPEKCLQCFVQG